MTAAENKTMVQVMFTLFIAMFAATVMDVKEYMHGRAAVRYASAPLPAAFDPPPVAVTGKAGSLPRRFQHLLDTGGRDTAPSSESPHPGLQPSVGAAVPSMRSHQPPGMPGGGGSPGANPSHPGLQASEAVAAPAPLRHDQRFRQPGSFWESVAAGEPESSTVKEMAVTRVEIRPLWIDENAGRAEGGRMECGPESGGGNRE